MIFSKLKSVLLLSILLIVFVMVGQVAFANTIVNEVNISYDTTIVSPDTMWTLDELHYVIQNYVTCNTTGLTMYTDSNSQAFQFYYDEFWGPTSYYSVENLNENTTYGLGVGLHIDNNYDVPDSVKAANNETCITEFTNFKVKVNGSYRNDVYIKYSTYDDGFLDVIIPTGKPTKNTYTPYIEEIFISDSEVTLGKGDTKQYSAQVKGIAINDVTLSWTVTGNNSSSTTISSTGLLTIGGDETASTITVTVSNSADGKTATSTVTISTTQLTIDSVEISTSKNSLYPGESQYIDLSVEGTADDKTVEWTITGKTSTKTTMDGQSLYVGRDETASTITVTATSNYDSTKSDSLEINILESDIIDSIDIIYDATEFPFDADTTCDDFMAWVKNNTTSSLGTEVLSDSNTALYRKEDSGFWYVGDSEDQLGEDYEYVILYGIIPSASNYSFPMNVICLDTSEEKQITEIDGFTIKVNGVTRDDVYIEYSDSWNCVMAFVPIGKTTGVQEIKGDINGDGIITVDDIRLLIQAYVSFGHVEFTDEELAVRDMNGDSIIGVDDIRRLIQAYLKV